MDNYLSLFDYLGKAAGEGLGYEVAKEAGKRGERIKTKEVRTSKYNGPVNMFRKEFLDDYFKNK